MARLTKSERTGLCLLALILAVVLVFLALRRPVGPTCPVGLTDSIMVSAPADTIVRKKSKPKHATKHATKPAPQPRRHLNDPF